MTSPVWHPFFQHGLDEPIPHVASARGSLLHLADGRSLIDGISSWWVTTHGHCEPRIAAAIAQQAAKLDQLIFAGYTHAPAEEVAHGLIDIAPRFEDQPQLTHIFYSDSGSTAVEVALKMALGYWHNVGEPQRHRILVMQHSYHGDTIGAMSIGERGVYNAAWTPLLFDVGTIPFPAHGRERECLDTLEAACAERPAAFIVEPLILGAGGMLVYSAELLRDMAAICRRHGVLFIVDEVMTGWGRTGTLFACEQDGIAPDITCIAKGLGAGYQPIGAMLCSARIYKTIEEGTGFFQHGHTYNGHPTACVAGLAVVSAILDRGLLPRVQAQGEKLAHRLADRFGQHPHIGDLRGRGLFHGIEIVADRDTKEPFDPSLGISAKIKKAAFEEGLVCYPMSGTIDGKHGDHVMLAPPFIISDAQLDEITDKLATALEKAIH